MKIGWASADWSPSWPDERGNPTPGGSGWYRVHVPAAALARLGHSCTVGTLVADLRSGLLGVREWGRGGVGCTTFDLDVVVLQRCMNEGVHHRVLAARANGQRVLQDIDDWWEGIDPSNRAFATSSPKVDPGENRDHFRQSIAASDGVVCSTPFLAERYRRLNRRTWVVRNCVDATRWPITPRHDVPTLGWVGAIPWRTAGDLEALTGFLGQFCEAHGLRVVHSGAMGNAPGLFAEMTGLDRHEVEVVESGMRPVAEIPRLWDGIDVALVPLSRKPFSFSAKSCIAGLSAAARGIPFVATAADEYEWLRKEHGIGRTTRNPAAWRRHLEDLLDPDVRSVEGMRNRQRVLALNPSWMASEWSGVLQEVA